MPSKALFHPASSLSTFPSAHQLLWLPHPLLPHGLPTCPFLCLEVISSMVAELVSSPTSLSVTSSRRSSLPTPSNGGPALAHSTPPCLFPSQHFSEFTVSIPVCSQCLVCLSHLNISSRGTGILPVLLIILIPTSSTVPSSVSVKSIKQSINQNSMN